MYTSLSSKLINWKKLLKKLVWRLFGFGTLCSYVFLCTARSQNPRGPHFPSPWEPRSQTTKSTPIIVNERVLRRSNGW